MCCYTHIGISKSFHAGRATYMRAEPSVASCCALEHSKLSPCIHQLPHSQLVLITWCMLLLLPMCLSAACAVAVGVAGVISAGQGFVESASNMVPENVPRPVAKTGVAVATGLVAFWVLQKVRK